MRRSELDFGKEKLPLLESLLGSINELLSSPPSIAGTATSAQSLWLVSYIPSSISDHPSVKLFTKHLGKKKKKAGKTVLSPQCHPWLCHSLSMQVLHSSKMLHGTVPASAPNSMASGDPSSQT